MKITKENSEAIRAVSFLCALLVVPIHCTSATTLWIFGEVSAPRWAVALQLLGSDTVSRLAVPWFFVVSGFFLAHHLTASAKESDVLAWWRSSILKRLLSLGVPFLVWNAVYYLFKLVTGKYGFALPHAVEQLTGWNLRDVPACGQFWYVRCLIFYVFAAPFFFLLMRSRRVGAFALFALAASWVAGVSLPVVYVQPLDFSYLLYFSAGLFFALHGLSFQVPRGGVARRIVTAVFLVCAVCVVGGGVMRMTPVFRLAGKLMILSGLPSLWFWRGRIAKALHPCAGLWGMGFFVYAFHILVLSTAGRLFRLLPADAYHSVGYLAKAACGICVSLLAGWLLKRCANPVYRTLCGGRG